MQTNVKIKHTLLHFMNMILKDTVKVSELTFQINAVLVRQIQNIIANLRLDWNPLPGPVDVHNINTRGKDQTHTVRPATQVESLDTQQGL